MEKIVAFIKKYKERVAVLSVLFSFLLFIGGGMALQSFNKQKRAKVLEGLPKKVVLQVGEGDESRSEEGKSTPASSSGSTFFLQPSAQDLVQQLQDMQNLKPAVAQKKLRFLRVLWPVFFFESRNEDGKSVAYFDIAEDGFGVVVQAEYSPQKFPEFSGLERGHKLWLGGEIVAVDLAGTGRVELALEYTSFSEDVPGVAASSPEE